MPRPRPLTNVASALPQNREQHQLTPRTPHSASGSRTSRAEQGFAKLQLSEAVDDDFDDQDTLQSAPLLASSSTARFSIRSSRGQRDNSSAKDDGKKHNRPPAELLSLAVSRLPLAIGILMAGILLILIVLSFTRPEALHKYVGAKLPPIPSSSSSNLPTSSSLDSESKIHILSYENYTTFPLHPMEYLVECAKQHKGYMAHGDYWDISPMGAADVHHPKQDQSVCSSTITYMLDGTVGLTADLALVAQAAALAHERNRTFFIDDTYWNRGKWSDHFEDVRARQPGPQPGCKPPPANELVACPRTARHWVINSKTAKFHFGHAFSNHYDDPYAHALNRLKPIFESSRSSFQSIIHPNAENMALVELARQTFSAFLRDVNRREGGAGSIYLGTHIRRGDRKTLSYSFTDRKVPLHDYLAAIKSTWTRLHSAHLHQVYPVVYLATDSPEAHQEFSKLYQGETFSLFDIGDSRLRALASPGEYYQKKFDDLDLRSRIIATRGMIVDLALVSGLWVGEDNLKPDAVICALSSSVCRLAAVGLGWERAFGNVEDMGDIDKKGDRWIDVDQKGQIVPVWQAFELF